MALTTTPSELTATALTLTTVAQPNITSVGTLTGLSVTSASSSNNFINIDTTSATQHSGLILKQGGSSKWDLYADASTSKFYLSNISTVRIAIDTSGNVGINHTTPEHHLHVVEPGATNEDGIVKIGGSTAALGLELRYDQTGSTVTQIIANPTYTHTAAIMKLVVDGDANPDQLCLLGTGYVGIGENSPDNKLHITGADWNNAHIKIERTDNGSANDPGIVFKSAAGANNAYGLGSMWFQNALDGNAYAMIRARTDDSSGTSGKLEFITSTGVVGNGTTPALTIDSNQIAVFRQGSYEAEIHSHSWATSLETRTSDGSDNYAVGLDAGSGTGSNGRGAGLWCYGNENGTYPASIVAQVGSGGLFRIFAGTTGGSEALQVDAAGHLLPGSDSTKNLGSTSKRWDNLYVNDMHFSNEGSDGNEVDGTTGDWTLQEGEEHLYIINNKSGKKFKFSLEEIE